MNKLLASNFSRLMKNRLFWGECICMFVFGVALVENKYMEQVKYHSVEILDTGFFAYALVIGFAIAIFCSMFLGTEYSDGTIRNKVIVGHSRIQIYLVNLMTNIVVSFVLCLCFLVPVLAIGIPLLGPLTTGTHIILWMFLGTLCLAIAFCSVFTMFSMINSNKPAVVVTGMLFMIAFLMIAVGVSTKLEAPEFITSYNMGQDGGLEPHTEPNPKYLTESERVFWQFIYDVLPTGQALQYAMMTAIHLWQMPLYSILLSLGTTTAGVLIFRKKDLK